MGNSKKSRKGGKFLRFMWDAPRKAMKSKRKSRRRRK